MVMFHCYVSSPEGIKKENTKQSLRSEIHRLSVLSQFTDGNRLPVCWFLSPVRRCCFFISRKTQSAISFLYEYYAYNAFLKAGGCPLRLWFPFLGSHNTSTYAAQPPFAATASGPRGSTSLTKRYSDIPNIKLWNDWAQVEDLQTAKTQTWVPNDIACMYIYNHIYIYNPPANLLREAVQGF